MSHLDTALRMTTDTILAANDAGRAELIKELIKTRKLSSAMAALNEQLLNGSDDEQERARTAIRKLGFDAD